MAFCDHDGGGTTCDRLHWGFGLSWSRTKRNGAKWGSQTQVIAQQGAGAGQNSQTTPAPASLQGAHPSRKTPSDIIQKAAHLPPQTPSTISMTSALLLVHLSPRPARHANGTLILVPIPPRQSPQLPTTVTKANIPKQAPCLRAAAAARDQASPASIPICPALPARRPSPCP